MTLNVETPRVVYTGSGTRGPFALSVGGTPITYSAASHIIAERYTDAGVLIETLVDGVDYDLSATSVATGDSAATLTIKVSADVLASDEKLVIYRETPLSQTLSLVQGGGFSSSANEANYDKIFRLLQELYLQFGRQITINPISSGLDVNLPVPQAGYVVGWNADGDGFENYSSIPTDTVSVSSAWAQVINKATIALGLTEAGFSAFIQTLINDADQATALNTLGAQPLDADLTAIAALGYTSGQYLTKKTAANTHGLITLSSFAETLLDDASADAARTTLAVFSRDPAYAPILLNGDCAIDQPSAGASVAATGGIYCRDGLFIAKSGAGGFSWQRQTNANLLTARNPVITCDRYTVTAAAASPGAGDVYVADMRIEGLRASRLQYGRASARKAWLCATARASIACSIGFSLQNSAYDRSFPMSQVLAANTTTDIALEVPGCTDGTWLTDNGVGLRLRMALGIGATGGGVAGAWASANKIGVAGAGLMATNGATLDITAWELVIGDVAPGLYIPPDPALEFLRTQREFTQIPIPLQNHFGGAFGTSACVGPYTLLPVKMRTTPAWSASSAGIEYYSAGGSWTPTTLLNYSTGAAYTQAYCVTDSDGRGKLLRPGSGGANPSPVVSLDARL